MIAARPLTFIGTTGAVDFLSEPTENRRFWLLQPVQLHEFRITVPGHKPLHGLFHNAQAARLQAEQLYPESHPASVVCTSRQRREAKP
jgi:hypothetical protein